MARRLNLGHTFLRRPLLPAARRLASREATLYAVAGAGIALEASLLIAWLPHFALMGSAPQYIPLQQPVTWFLGNGPGALNRFLLLIGLITPPYLIALVLAERLQGRAAVNLAYGGAVIFGLTMLALAPGGSTDIYANIITGRLLWVHGLNPITTPPLAVLNDPLYRYATDWQRIPSPYGPLWFLVTWPAVLVGGEDITRNLIAFKTIPLLFELTSLGLLAMIMRHLNPRRTAAAIIGLGWNPLVLWEFPGNGHNDIVMVAFILLALLLLLSDRWPLAFTALAAAVLVKYVAIILGPIFAVWLLKRYGRRAVSPLIAGIAVAAAFTGLAFLPFWAGADTFAPLFTASNRFISSPGAALLGKSGVLLPGETALNPLKAQLSLAFLLLYGLTLWRLRPDPESAVRACIEAMCALLALAIWWFWPWYAVWALALGVLLPGSAHARLTVLSSLTVLLIYLCLGWPGTVWNFSASAMATGTALVVFTGPALYAITRVWLPAHDDKPEPGSSAAASEALAVRVRR